MSYCHLCGTKLEENPVPRPLQEGQCFDCTNCEAPTHWTWNADKLCLVLYVSGECCPRCNKIVQDTQEASVE